MESKEINPLPTKILPQTIKNIFRKLPIIKNLAYELEINFYKYIENNSEQLISIIIPARNEEGNKELFIKALNKFKQIFTDLEIIFGRQ